jgi:hypothetical protein
MSIARTIREYHGRDDPIADLESIDSLCNFLLKRDADQATVLGQRVTLSGFSNVRLARHHLKHIFVVSTFPPLLPQIEDEVDFGGDGDGEEEDDAVNLTSTSQTLFPLNSLKQNMLSHSLTNPEYADYTELAIAGGRQVSTRTMKS